MLTADQVIERLATVALTAILAPTATGIVSFIWGHLINRQHRADEPAPPEEDDSQWF